MTEQTEVSSMDELVPDKILGEILRHCPLSSLNIFRSVSKKWLRVVDRHVGRVLITTSRTRGCFIDNSGSSLDKLTISGSFWMTLSEKDKEDESEMDDDSKNSGGGSGDASSPGSSIHLPEICEADRVRRLGFVGAVGFKPLENFVSQCKFLTGLYLHLSVFDKDTTTEQKASSKVSGSIPLLRELVIDSAGMNTGIPLDYKRAFDHVTTFLDQNHFPRLYKFLFGLPHLESREGIVAQSVSNFLAKHSCSIRAFSLNQKYYVSGQHDDSDSESEDDDDEDNDKKKRRSNRSKPRSSARMKSLNYECLSLKQLGESAKKLKPVLLEEFHVVLARKQESAPLWKNMLLYQDSLQKCIFVGDKLPCPVTSISVNSGTLVTLCLDIREGVSMKCFQNCTRLKHLSLGGRKERDDDYDNRKHENQQSLQHSAENDPEDNFLLLQLQHAHYLPPSLESLHLLNLRTHKDDLHFIAFKLPLLKDLTMVNLGWQDDLGLRLSDLVQLWIGRKLDHFCIQSSLNLMSYSELEADERSTPEVNLLACLVQSNSFAAASRLFLDVRKNEHGMYTTAKKGNDSSTTSLSDLDGEVDVFQVPNSEVLNEDEEESDESSEDDDDDDDDSDSYDDEGSGESGSDNEDNDDGDGTKDNQASEYENYDDED